MTRRIDLGLGPSRREALGAMGGGMLGLVGGVGTASASGRVVRDDLVALFRAEGVEGTMVVVDAASGQETVIGARADERRVPASTYKIVNSLIALETGVVRDENEILPFGGGPQPYPTWAKDQSMREAIAVSAVPIYQEVARRIGLERQREWLARLDYGNRDPGTVVDRFWLDGPLAISPAEQARFAAKLARGQLPMSARAQAIVRDILRIEASDGRSLHAKTGVCASCRPMVGWWTGWVERSARATAFSLALDMGSIADAPKRLTIGRAVLAALGAW